MQEVIDDLSRTFDLLRSENPELRFLLTVSPVPLVATASKRHVLTATTYSKSVLRAAAGHLAETRADTDYFPSYELIATAPFRGLFFEPNLRSVTAEGVAFVMRQFFSAIEGPGRWRPGEGPGARESAPSPVAADTEICDEIVLQNWAGEARPARAASTPAAPLLLMGDSQMGMCAKALDEFGIPYVGGALMNGTQWHRIEFGELDHPPFFMPVPEVARERWSDTWKQFFQRTGSHVASDSWIITNIGTHSRSMYTKGEGFWAYLDLITGQVLGPIRSLSIADIRKYLVYARTPHVSILSRLARAGYNVVLVTDPPCTPYNQDLAGAIDHELETIFATVGCRVFSARKWIRRLGGWPQEFASSEIDPSTGKPDWEHGSADYYRELLREVFREFDVPGMQVEGRAVQPA